MDPVKRFFKNDKFADPPTSSCFRYRRAWPVPR